MLPDLMTLTYNSATHKELERVVSHNKGQIKCEIFSLDSLKLLKTSKVVGKGYTIICRGIHEFHFNSC